jgi:large subunit ribosomal protein L6
MSRIGKKIIQIPSGVEVSLKDGLITVKGPVATLVKSFNSDISINITAGEITLSPLKNNLETKALWGTYSALILSMVKGVTTPFEKKLILEGIGFKSEVKGDNLVLALGFSHPVDVLIPKTLTVKAEKNIISISGADKEEVGQFAANLRSLKKPEPYKGKGMR